MPVPTSLQVTIAVLAVAVGIGGWMIGPDEPVAATEPEIRVALYVPVEETIALDEGNLAGVSIGAANVSHMIDSAGTSQQVTTWVVTVWSQGSAAATPYGRSFFYLADNGTLIAREVFIYGEVPAPFRLGDDAEAAPARGVDRTPPPCGLVPAPVAGCTSAPGPAVAGFPTRIAFDIGALAPAPAREVVLSLVGPGPDEGLVPLDIQADHIVRLAPRTRTFIEALPSLDPSLQDAVDAASGPLGLTPFGTTLRSGYLAAARGYEHVDVGIVSRVWDLAASDGESLQTVTVTWTPSDAQPRLAPGPDWPPGTGRMAVADLPATVPRTSDVQARAAVLASAGVGDEYGFLVSQDAVQVWSGTDWRIAAFGTAPPGGIHTTLTVDGDGRTIRLVDSFTSVPNGSLPAGLASQDRFSALQRPTAPAAGMDWEVPASRTAGAAGGIALVVLLARHGGWIFWALLSRDETENQATRQRIMAVVAAHPGIHFSALRRATGLATGAVQYHLHALEKHGLLVSAGKGGYRCYCIKGSVSGALMQAAPFLRSDTARGVLRALMDGAQHTEDLMTALQLGRTATHHHLRRLRGAGLIEGGTREIHEINVTALGVQAHALFGNTTDLP